MIQQYENETMSNIYGGSIFVHDTINRMVTIVRNSVFFNNFGDEGAAITVKQGGLLFVINSTFTSDELNSEVDDFHF